MHRIPIVVVCTAVLLFACSNDDRQTRTDVHEAAAFGDWGFDTSAMDRSVRPGDDFYRYANGAWLATTVIPDDKSRVGSRSMMQDRNNERIEGLVKAFAGIEADATMSKTERMIGDLYASFLDIETRNRRGLEPLGPELQRIQAIDSHDDLAREFARYPETGGKSPFSGFVDTDFNRPDRQLFFLDVGGLGMFSARNYLGDDDRYRGYRDAYAEWVRRGLELLQLPADDADVASVIELEIRIAASQPSARQRRDFANSMHPYTLRQVGAEFPGFAWEPFFGELHIDEYPHLIVRFPDSVGKLVDVIAGTPLPVWKAYLSFHVLNGNTQYLDEQSRDARQQLYSRVVSGQASHRDNEAEALRFVQRVYGFEIGRAFVERYFPESSKRRVEAMFDVLKSAFRTRLERVDWMDDATRREAYAKLGGMTAKIGYPDVWREAPDILISRGMLYENVRAARVGRWRASVRRIGQPPDRAAWGMTPQSAGAGFHPALNEITVPAGNLMPPFFDAHADPAVNYGAIGGVLGHELLHAFDDIGRHFDAAGMLRDWWTPQSAEAFEQRAAVVEEQFNRYEVLPGHFVDGKLTLGENIADIFGLALAFDAYKASGHADKHRASGEFTPEQRFFLGWAQMRRAIDREQLQIQLIETGSHSPPHLRVNAVLRNIDAWYDAFDVMEGDALYLAPSNRADIW